MMKNKVETDLNTVYQNFVLAATIIDTTNKDFDESFECLYSLLETVRKAGD